MTLSINDTQHSSLKCYNANCQYAERRVFHCNDECCYAEYLYAQCRYTECGYAECHYAECRGAFLRILINLRCQVKKCI
jgi:hypothetical protein